ncbi:Pycsar system effector family protein [Streptomyces sp. NPDC059816]|uniref:Pycsar system effector family protein n=1 Tax=Streptomyces sp. NPDC059816 TaxID=3346960 RepID=UPI00365B95CB
MSASTLDERVASAHEEVRAEIARTDQKAGLLLAFVGVLLAGALTVATSTTSTRAPASALAVGGAGVVFLVMAAAVALWVVRPVLARSAVGGFPCWATLTPEDLFAHITLDRRLRGIGALSQIAVAKHRRLRRAVDLIAVGGALLATATALTFLGGVR